MFDKWRWRALLALKAWIRRRLPYGVRERLRRHLLGRRSGAMPLLHGAVGYPEPLNGPIVSIIIPCFNYGAYVGVAISSVLNQTLQDFEIIVVDDGSTDPDTVAILNGLAHPKLRLHRQANAGLPAARNAGINLARGHYICCLDADDALEKTYLEKCVSLLESNPGVRLAYSWLELFGDETGYWETVDLDIDRLLMTNHVIVSAVFVREDWVAVGGYSTEMRGGYEDWEFWLRLGGIGVRGKAIPEPLFRHFRHGRTMTHEANAIGAELMSRMYRRNRALFEDKALRKRIRRAYRDVQLERPFGRVSDAGQFRLPKKRHALLVLLPWLESGGAEIIMRDLLEGLAADYSIYVVTTLAHTHPLHRDFDSLVEAIYHLPNFLADRDWIPFLVNLLSTREIGAILLSGSEFGYSALKRLRELRPNVRVIDLLHNDSALGHIGNAIHGDRHIDIHIGVNRHIGETLVARGVREDKCVTIRNGVDLGHWPDRASLDPRQARAAMGLGAEDFVCLYVGRFSPEKQPEWFGWLAEQFADDPAVRFVMIGDGPLKPKLEARYPMISFLEPRPRGEMPRVYAAADVLVMTSAIEGLPMVLLEALAVGVPVLSTRAGEIGGVIKDGVNGFTVPLDSPMDLVMPLRRLQADSQLLHSLSARARSSLIEQGLTLGQMVDRYRRVLVLQSGVIEEGSR